MKFIGYVMLLLLSLISLTGCSNIPETTYAHGAVTDRGDGFKQGGAGDNKPTQDSQALLTAAAKGDTATVRTLACAAGVDVNGKNRFGSTALSWAATNGHLETVKALLDCGADVNIDGGSALMGAAGEGHLDVVQLLLFRGADVNRKDEEGRTALLLAAANGRTDVVWALIDRGANVNAKAKNKLTTYGAMTPLIAAALYKGNADTVRALLEKGADKNAMDMEGETVLMIAADRGHADIVQTLIAAGVDVNAKSAQGDNTALMSASANGHTDIVQVLLLMLRSRQLFFELDQLRIGRLHGCLVELGLQSKVVQFGFDFQALQFDVGAQTGKQMVALGALGARRRLLQ